MTNFILGTSNKNALNKKCEGRRFYMVETAEFGKISKSTSIELKGFIDSPKDSYRPLFKRNT